jgi:hypothetical protein
MTAQQPQDLYSFLGFISNPFESNTAEREPQIASYAVRPPYLDRTNQASHVGRGIFVLDGARGSGKSATRLTIAKSIWQGTGAKPLVVALTNFNIFRPYIKGGLSLDLFATQIAFLTIETILSWLSSLPKTEAEARIAEIDSLGKKLIDKFVSNFFLNRADNARSATAQETYDLLNVSLQNKAVLWAEKRWDTVSTVIAGLAATLGKKYMEVDIGDPDSYAALLKRQQTSDFSDPQYVFARTVEVARLFGFSGVLVQIDKIDETDWTTTSIPAAGQLIFPILSNIGMHEIDGLSWSVFAWDKVTKHLISAYGQQLRFDKIQRGSISWEPKYLEGLIQKRLEHFSNGAISQLEKISVDGTDISTILRELIGLTGQSPRQLITALDAVVSEHAQRNQSELKRLDKEAFERGMDIYAVRSLNDNGLIDDARQIAKLGALIFVTKDVQSLLRQSAQSARAKIDKWVNELQLVESIGTRPTESTGRPVDEFRISDPRVLRVLNRNL